MEDRWRYYGYDRGQRRPGASAPWERLRSSQALVSALTASRVAAWQVPGKSSAPAPGQEREWEMGIIRLEHVLAEVKQLSPKEQQELRDTLDQWLRHARPENRLEDVLVEAGLLRTQRPRGEDTAPPRRSPRSRSVGNPSPRRSSRSVAK